MRNYQKYGFDTIQTKNFTAFCNVYDNRVGFVHECRIEWDGVTYYAKTQYYNRTWESYEFESVILKTIERMPKSVREQARAEFEHYGQKLSEELDAKFSAWRAAWDSLADEQKKIFSGVTVENKEQLDAVCTATQVMSLLNK